MFWGKWKEDKTRRVVLKTLVDDPILEKVQKATLEKFQCS
jgi:hypothetical protein